MVNEGGGSKPGADSDWRGRRRREWRCTLSLRETSLSDSLQPSCLSVSPARQSAVSMWSCEPHSRKWWQQRRQQLCAIEAQTNLRISERWCCCCFWPCCEASLKSSPWKKFTPLSSKMGQGTTFHDNLEVPTMIQWLCCVAEKSVTLFHFFFTFWTGTQHKRTNIRNLFSDIGNQWWLWLFPENARHRDSYWTLVRRVHAGL